MCQTTPHVKRMQQGTNKGQKKGAKIRVKKKSLNNAYISNGYGEQPLTNKLYFLNRENYAQSNRVSSLSQVHNYLAASQATVHTIWLIPETF